MQTQCNANQESRNKALLEVIRQGLVTCGNINTEKMLGDRSSYIGVSDLARYAECPRSVLAGKIYPAKENLSKLLTLERGHWFENGIMDCFKSLELKFMPQLEVSVNYNNVPVKAHLDFTFVWDKPYPAVRILEIKSMQTIPADPYPSHVFQTTMQASLLQEYWSKPVFSLRDENGKSLYANISFSEICKKYLDISLPENPDQISVESWLLCLSMKDAAAFGPYEYEQEFLNEALLLAEKAWTQYGILQHDTLALDRMPYAPGFHLLCDTCEYSMDCPKFAYHQDAKDWDNSVALLMELKNQKSDLAVKIKAIEANLKMATENADGNWLDTGNFRFKNIITKGRKSLDKELLKVRLDNLFMDAGLTELSAVSIISECEREGMPSNRLKIMETN